MENQQSKPNNHHIMTSNVKAVEQAIRRARLYDWCLRVFALALTFVTTIIVGVDKETQIISVSIADNVPMLQIPITAKWQYESSMIYLLVANAIACCYAAGSLAYAISPGPAIRRQAPLVLNILDIVMTGFLFSAGGASAAISVIARNGNSHTRWNKVCNLFERYCHHMGAALVLSMIASAVFMWLAVLNVLNLHKRFSA